MPLDAHELCWVAPVPYGLCSVAGASYYMLWCPWMRMNCAGLPLCPMACVVWLVLPTICFDALGSAWLVLGLCLMYPTDPAVYDHCCRYLFSSWKHYVTQCRLSRYTGRALWFALGLRSVAGASYYMLWCPWMCMTCAGLPLCPMACVVWLVLPTVCFDALGCAWLVLGLCLMYPVDPTVYDHCCRYLFSSWKHYVTQCRLSRYNGRALWFALGLCSVAGASYYMLWCPWMRMTCAGFVSHVSDRSGCLWPLLSLPL